MPSVIPVDLSRDELAPLLVPGEQPLLAESVRESVGVDHSQRAPEEQLGQRVTPRREPGGSAR